LLLWRKTLVAFGDQFVKAKPKHCRLSFGKTEATVDNANMVQYDLIVGNDNRDIINTRPQTQASKGQE
jgi:hypothetical protein